MAVLGGMSQSIAQNRGWLTLQEGPVLLCQQLHDSDVAQESSNFNGDESFVGQLQRKRLGMQEATLRGTRSGARM